MPPPPMNSSPNANQDLEFGVEAIQEVCGCHAGEPPLHLPGHLFAPLQEFTASGKQCDDMTAAYFHLAR